MLSILPVPQSFLISSNYRFKQLHLSSTSTPSRQRLNMVFDFLRKRSEEGFAQIQNIASKTIEGKLVEALQESADYVRLRQRIDAENLRKLTAGLNAS